MTTPSITPAPWPVAPPPSFATWTPRVPVKVEPAAPTAGGDGFDSADALDVSVAPTVRREGVRA